MFFWIGKLPISPGVFTVWYSMKLRGGNGRNFPTKERASLFKLPQLLTDSHILFHSTSSSMCNVPMGRLPREVDLSDWTGGTESPTGCSSHSKPLCFQRTIWLLWHLLIWLHLDWLLKLRTYVPYKWHDTSAWSGKNKEPVFAMSFYLMVIPHGIFRVCKFKLFL